MSRTDPSPDLLLARAALAGERRALESFIQRMSCVPQIMAALNRRMGSPFSSSDLDDMAQEALIRIWAKLPGFEGHSALETWAYPFCSMELVDGLRRKQRLSRVELSGELELAQEDSAARAGPLDFEHLHAALERLPPSEAGVLRLKCFEELTFDEIGARLGIPLNTAKTHFYRGLQRLRRALARADREETLR